MASAAYTGQSKQTTAGLVGALSSDPTWCPAVVACGGGNGSTVFAASAPTAAGNDGDTVYVTSDGSATGVILTEYRYVTAANAWVAIPQGVQWSISNW